MGNLKQWFYGVTNAGLFLAGIANLGIGTYAAAGQNVAAAGASLTAGLVLLFAATVDRFESVKGLGVEAKTRKLDQKIEQADDALRRVKELTELAGTALIDLNSKMGRWDSMPAPRDAYHLAQKVRSVMKALGSDDSTVRTALKPWVEATSGDLAVALLAPLSSVIREKLSELENQRAGKSAAPDDLELQRLNESIRQGREYIRERINRVRQIEIEDCAARLIQLFDDAPLIGPEDVAPLRAKAARFAPAISELWRNLHLADPEPWCDEIDAWIRAQSA